MTKRRERQCIYAKVKCRDCRNTVQTCIVLPLPGSRKGTLFAIDHGWKPVWENPIRFTCPRHSRPPSGRGT